MFASIIVALLSFVNVAQASGADLASLNKRIRIEGQTHQLGAMTAKDLGLKDATVKFEEVEERSTVDGLYRAAMATDSGMIFVTIKTEGDRTETFNCRTDMSGKPKAAFLVKGRIDSEGKGVKGSAEVTKLKPRSSGVKEFLARELDFWLNGKGRKPKAAAEAPKP